MHQDFGRVASVVMSVVVAAATVVACSHPGDLALRPGNGAVGIAHLHGRYGVHAGDEFGFPLGDLHNVSDDPVTLVDLRVDAVPAGVQIVRYALVDLEGKGEPSASRIGEPPADGDFSRYPNRPVSSRLVVAPHTRSRWLPVVYLRVDDASQRLTVRGCTFVYEQGGDTHTTHGDCAFGI